MERTEYDKYIKEMREMQKRATAAVVAPPSSPTASPLEGRGFLGVNVTTTRELYPVKNARVRVFSGSITAPLFIADGNTDESGKTELFALPAPPLSLSQSPNPTTPPFATYNILIEADGFLPAVYTDAAIFDKVTSIQNVNLVPKTLYNQDEQNVYDEKPDYNL